MVPGRLYTIASIPMYLQNSKSSGENHISTVALSEICGAAMPQLDA